LLLDSAYAGERLQLEEAWLPGAPIRIGDARAALLAVELIDEEDRVPTKAWEAWIVPQLTRLQIAVESGRKGGLARAARSDPTREPAATLAREPLANERKNERSNERTNGATDVDNQSTTSVAVDNPPTTMMGFRPKSRPGSHDGQHGEACMVCFPPERVTVKDAAKAKGGG
jgi:hypothetical protein